AMTEESSGWAMARGEQETVSLSARARPRMTCAGLLDRRHPPILCGHLQVRAWQIDAPRPHRPHTALAVGAGDSSMPTRRPQARGPTAAWEGREPVRARMARSAHRCVPRFGG